MSDIYNQISIEILREIRGPLSKLQSSRKLGKNRGKFSKWETAGGKIYWRDFVDLCERFNVDLRLPIRKHLHFSARNIDGRKLFLHLAGDLTPKELCAKLKCSPSTLSRCLNDGRYITLPKVLALIDLTGRLYQFVGQLVEPQKIPSLGNIHRTTINAFETFSRYPEAAAFLCYLETEPYLQEKVHVFGVFAKRIGISAKKEREIVAELIKHRLIAESKKKYTPRTYYTHVAGTKSEQHLQTKKIQLFWQGRVMEALRSQQFDQNFCTGGHEVFPASPELQELVQKEILRFRRRLHSILGSWKEPVEDVFVFQMQMLNLFQAEEVMFPKKTDTSRSGC